MEFKKTNWKNNDITTPLSAANMNKIEDAIVQLVDELDMTRETEEALGGSIERLDAQNQQILKTVNEKIQIHHNKVSYSIPLKESGWIRIAKVNDIYKNSSGTFTFDCYGVRPSGQKDVLTTSIFAVTCGINSLGNLVTDVLPISQAPELSGNANSGGSSLDGSGIESSGEGLDSSGQALEESTINLLNEEHEEDYTENEEGLVTSDEGYTGSSDYTGSGGSASGIFGLTTILIERYEGDIYVCGLINHPSTEQYSSLEIELKIDNNLNFAYLETLESVNLTEVNEYEKQLLEGTELEENKNYEWRISCNLQNYIAGLNESKEIAFNILGIVPDELYEITLLDLKYNTDVINISGNGITYTLMGNSYEYPNNLIDTNAVSSVIPLYPNYDNNEIIFTSKEVIENYLYYYHDLQFRVKSAKALLTLTVENGAADITLNEDIDNIISIASIEPYTKTIEIDFEDLICIQYSSDSSIKEFYLTLILEKTDIVLSIPFKPEMTSNVGNYIIENNDIYNFKLNLVQLSIHYTSRPYILFSIYNRLYELELDMCNLEIECYNRNCELESRIETLENSSDNNSGDTNHSEENLYVRDTIKPSQFQNYNTLKYMYCPRVKTIMDGSTSYPYGGAFKNSTIKEIYFDKLEYLGKYAFNECEKLITIDLPETLKSIRGNAFEKCYNLTYFNLPSSLNSTTSSDIYLDLSTAHKLTEIYNLSDISLNFYQYENPLRTIHTSLDEPSILTTTEDGFIFAKDKEDKYHLVNYIGESTDLVLPEKFQAYNGPTTYEINQYALSYITTLNSVVIPYTISDIKPYTFAYCKFLNEVHLPEGLKTIGKHAFYMCDSLYSISLPEGLETIGTNAFYYSPLSTIDFPSTLKSIGEQAFAGNSLKILTLPEGLETIESYAFYFTNTLETVILPGTLTSIGYRVFRGDENLREVIIGEGITNLGDSIFDGCINLTTVSLPSTLKETSRTFTGCKSLYSINLPEGLEVIGKSTFSFCPFETIIIPNTVHTLGDTIFYGCSNLKEIVIPDSVTTMGNYNSFNSCASLEKVTISKNISKIASGDYSGCTNLKDIYLGYNGLVSLENTSAFKDVGATQGYVNIHVKQEYANQYINATNWSSLIAAGTIRIVGDYNE